MESNESTDNPIIVEEPACENRVWISHENIYLILAIAGFLLSELLPFFETAFGVEINGNGIFHIIKGLLTKNPEVFREGLEDLMDDSEQ